MILREGGEDDAFAAVAARQQGWGVALEAAAVGLEEGLALADSEIYALGKRHRATLGTQDADFRAKPGVQYTPKPSHTGRAPD